MTIQSAPDQEEFRSRVSSWLNDTIDRTWVQKPFEVGSDGESEFVAEARRIRSSLYEAGLAGITWPTEAGGQGLPDAYQRIFDSEARSYDIPGTGLFGNGLGMCGPTIVKHGTPEQRSKYLPALLRGDEIWCQLFSEPGAGSDVAGVQAKAVRSGSTWVINGQKTWTSGAHVARYGLAIVRTDPSRPKHDGITMFIIDLEAPGVTVRPLRQATGETHFNEVFFDDVECTDQQVVGIVNDGWRVATSLLMSERMSLGAGSGRRGSSSSQLIELARQHQRASDPTVRQLLSEVIIRERAIGFLGQRIKAGIEIWPGRRGSEGSLAKLGATALTKRAADIAMHLVGPASQAWPGGNDDAGLWSRRLMNSAATSIAGGTDEILRNIVGERILGLPKEPAVDRHGAFRDILSNGASGPR